MGGADACLLCIPEPKWEFLRHPRLCGLVQAHASQTSTEKGLWVGDLQNYQAVDGCSEDSFLMPA